MTSCGRLANKSDLFIHEKLLFFLALLSFLILSFAQMEFMGGFTSALLIVFYSVSLTERAHSTCTAQNILSEMLDHGMSRLEHVPRLGGKTLRHRKHRKQTSNLPSEMKFLLKFPEPFGQPQQKFHDIGPTQSSVFFCFLPF